MSNVDNNTERKPEQQNTEGNEGVETLEEARKLIRELRERHRMQSHQLLSWKRRYKLQEEHIARVNHERNEQLRRLSTQLILFEARLCRKQRDISVLLCQRESIIAKQQKLIKQLNIKLSEAGIDPNANNEETNLDSLNDSDSAVIMEDDDGISSINQHSYHHNGTGVPVIRSVSDALDTPMCNKYSMLRRSNCLLRRPEILETVYSVEEDVDGDGSTTTNTTTTTREQQEENEDDLDDNRKTVSAPQTLDHHHHRRTPKLGELTGSFERLEPQPQQQMTTYNRVMSNHRSVTKPKDVKYKRINKAKSKSLEELRGRLKNWVEKGNKIAISLDHSFA